MRARAACNDAFVTCHEIYRAARELLGSRVPTTQWQSASKFLWRPDVKPRLAEFVADFARAGERALAETFSGRKNAVMSTAFFGSTTSELPGKAAARNPGQRRSRKFPSASRLILFRMYYLGGAEYHAARRVLGISERTWSDWAEEIRLRVGDELLRVGMYPPARYFKQATFASTPDPEPQASTNDANRIVP
jgi:hypothetical protein